MVKEINKEEFENLIKEDNYSFIDFYALWCRPCMMMMPIIDEIASEIEGINFYKCNVDNNIELAQKLNIESIPRFMVFKSQKLVKVFVGAIPKEKFKSEILCLIQ